MLSRSVFFAFFFAACTSSVADSVDEAARVLNSAGKELHSAVLSIPEKEPALRALRELESAGSRDAVAALANYLRKEGGHPELKRQALAALGRIGSRDAVNAIAEFEVWAEARPKYVREVRLGLTDYPSHHFSPYEQDTLAEFADTDGTVWALFSGSVYHHRELWIGKKHDDRVMDVVLLDIDVPSPSALYELQQNARIRLGSGGGATQLRVVLGDIAHEVDLDHMNLSSDGDGVPDVRERHMGTDPTKPDSDGDRVADEKDGNPLTVPAKNEDETTLIRQAVFLLYFGVNESHHAIRTSMNTQEYRGYAGPVLWAPKAVQGCVNFNMEVTKLEDHRATVHYSDYEDGCAASGNTVELRKMHGRWVVIGYRLDVIA